jgi:Tol biopolymer transport system component
VAFLSSATNLVAGDTNAAADVFIKDMQTGAVTRVSTDSSGAQANGASEKLSISADGRYVAFRSVASNLVAGDTLGKWDIFIKDTASGAVVCASTGGNGDSGWPAISADGNWVTYPSLATNLVAGDTNNLRDIFLANRATGALTRVSTDSSGVQAANASGAPTVSGDGRYVAFWSAAANLVAGDTNAVWDIFRKDTLTGQVVRYSTSSSGAQASGGSDYPFISTDGSYVAFVSQASNLVAGDTNGAWDVFLGSKTL